MLSLSLQGAALAGGGGGGDRDGSSGGGANRFQLFFNLVGDDSDEDSEDIADDPRAFYLPAVVAPLSRNGRLTGFAYVQVRVRVAPGTNVWSNVHIHDLAELYLLALNGAPAGAFFYAENGENAMRDVCVAISKMLGYGGGTTEMTLAEAAGHWGEGPANDTMGSNSRVRAVRARTELGWAPAGPSLIEEIESGCYAKS